MKIWKFLIVSCICIMGVSVHIQAQSLQDLFKKENVSKVLESVAVTVESDLVDFTGIWSYTGPDVNFKTEDLKQKAGGDTTIESSTKTLEKQLNKANIEPGSIEFTINSDKTFIGKMGKQSLKGNYSYNKTSNTITFIYGRFIELPAKVIFSGDSLSLLFDCDKLLLLMTAYGEKLDQEAVSTITQLAKAHEGMLMGLKMKKG